MVGFAFLLIAMGALCAQAQTNQPSMPVCGETNPKGYEIDDSEPESPGPFHPLTVTELKSIRAYLEKNPDTKVAKSKDATLKSSYIFDADLQMADKDAILNHLDNGGPKPERKARVTLFRGDRPTPVVEELVCGPLPDITQCALVNMTNRRNPVEFNLRPLSGKELSDLSKILLKKVDQQIGAILMESFQAKFTGCSKKEDCLATTVSPIATGITKDMSKRLMMVRAEYQRKYQSLFPVGLALLVNFNDVDANKWTVEKVWYNSNLFSSLDDFKAKYNSNSVPKIKSTKPANDDSLFSSLRRRGDPQPIKPQRPPRLVEPDGRRYSVKEKRVEYMGWEFNYRSSSQNGPIIHDLRFRGERIAYEVAVPQIATLNSGYGPFGQTSNDQETSRLMGSRSKSVIPGAGCPETGTSLSAVFMNQYDSEPAVYNASFCLFENNNGNPLYRHLSYRDAEGGYYAGELDALLILRSIVSIEEKDYVIDYKFHKHGVLEVKVLSAGYIQSAYYSEFEKPYGHHLQDKINGNVHLHRVQFKVDLAIGGRNNRYETLEVVEDKGDLTSFLEKPFSQTKIKTVLKTTEKESISDLDFQTPKYHIFYNNEKKNKNNESRAYRIHAHGRANTKLNEQAIKERGLSWARHSMVVTKRKEDEPTSGSIYSMLDSLKPAVNFDTFYEDDEDIVDQDLVAWIRTGFYHIPHSEDLPNTNPQGNCATLYLSPHNYFPECPSANSTDSIYIDYKDPQDPTKGVKVDRNGNSRDQCVLPKPTLEEDLEADPDRVLESRRPNPTGF